LNIQTNIPLAPLTTLGVGGPARYFAEAQSEAQVLEALSFSDEKGLPLFVLGGGSNLLVSDRGWPGLVLKIGLQGIETQPANEAHIFHAAAGEDWDKFVAQTVEQNFAGLECMSGIPGTVGGTPVQNVGAYGQEVSQSITGVRVLDRTAKVLDFSNDECRFGYRSSIFNTEQRDRYIVLRVSYKLKRNGPPTLRYADLHKFFAGVQAPPSLRQVREAVLKIRKSKAMLLLPGDEDSRSAGSFFKNPVVTREYAERVQVLAEQRNPMSKPSTYSAADGLVKFPAAWLIEHSGFSKGFTRGPVGISRKHALAIVNRGGATAKDILALKNQIQQKVLDLWGLRLQPEPVFLGFEPDELNGAQ
jgi:UDP-N-acetylmuramate dehydrogenase